MSHSAEMCRAHKLCVFPDSPAVVIRLARLPGGTACCPFGIGQHHVDGALLCIDHNPVAVAQQRDWSADGRLGSDMPDAKAARGPGEAPIGDQSHVLALGLAL